MRTRKRGEEGEEERDRGQSEEERDVRSRSATRAVRNINVYLKEGRKERRERSERRSEVDRGQLYGPVRASGEQRARAWSRPFSNRTSGFVLVRRPVPRSLQLTWKAPGLFKLDQREEGEEGRAW